MHPCQPGTRPSALCGVMRWDKILALQAGALRTSRIYRNACKWMRRTLPLRLLMFLTWHRGEGVSPHSQTPCLRHVASHITSRPCLCSHQRRFGFLLANIAGPQLRSRPSPAGAQLATTAGRCSARHHHRLVSLLATTHVGSCPPRFGRPFPLSRCAALRAAALDSPPVPSRTGVRR